MLTPLSTGKVGLTLQNQKKELITHFPDLNKSKKASDFYDHLCSMEVHLKRSKELDAEIVYLNQAEVETLTTDFSTLKH